MGIKNKTDFPDESRIRLVMIVFELKSIIEAGCETRNIRNRGECLYDQDTAYLYIVSEIGPIINGLGVPLWISQKR